MTIESRKQLKSMIYGIYNTESDFAKRLNWPRQRLNKITTGRKEPDLAEAMAIAEGLNTSLETIAPIFLAN